MTGANTLASVPKTATGKVSKPNESTSCSSPLSHYFWAIELLSKWLVSDDGIVLWGNVCVNKRE